MSAISIRNIPESTYFALKDMAKKNHRSLQEEIRYLLDKEVKLTQESSWSLSKQWRAKLKGRHHSNSVQMINEDRSR